MFVTVICEVTRTGDDHELAGFGISNTCPFAFILDSDNSDDSDDSDDSEEVSL